MKRIKASSSNHFFLIDKEDFKRVSKYKWYRCENSKRPDNYYYRRSVRICGKIKPILLHRFLLGFPPGIIDHINRNPSDNRKHNLRVVDRSTNGFNCKMRGTNLSGFRGVTKLPNGRYRAQLKFYSKYIHIGVFKTPKAASVAYWKKTMELRMK